MEGRQFDELARALAANASRRQILKVITGGAAGGYFSLLGVKRRDTRAAMGLLAPVEAGVALTVIHGYNDPLPTEHCPAPGMGRADHCKNQKYGLDFSVSNGSDILAPTSGTIGWTSGDCLGLRHLDQGDVNLTICHFASFKKRWQRGDPVAFGECLGTRAGHIHLSLDDRYRSTASGCGPGTGRNCPSIPFTDDFAIEGQGFEPGPDTERNKHAGEVLPGSTNQLTCCPSGQKPCNGDCIRETDCCTDADCTGRRTCQNGTCIAGCGPSHVSCNGECLTRGRLQTDPENCGECGNSCNGGACRGGTCRCSDPLTACGNACVDTTSDPDNCSGCGVVCPDVPNATRNCEPAPLSGAACVYACHEGFGDCDGDILANGCETGLSDDAGNCGACGFSCATVSPNMFCVDGACACQGGFGFCGGACIPLGTVGNCLGCSDGCDDGDPCTADSCDPVGGCQHAVLADGTPCGPNSQCLGGQCVATSFDLVLSGGPSPTDHIGIDDDLEVYLNGALIFRDRDNLPGGPTMIPFTGSNGDQLRVVAIDGSSGFCEFLSPLYLHRVSDGAIQILLAEEIFNDCVNDGGNDVFFDQTFTIALP